MGEEMQSKEALKSQLDKEFIKKYRCLYNRRYKPVFRAVISHYVDNVTDINEENLLERLKTHYEEQEYIKKMKTLLQTQFSAETQKVLEEIIFEGKKLRKLG